MENFSVTTQQETAEAPKSLTLHAVFYSFLSDGIKQDSATTAAHSKQTIKLC